MTDPKDLLAIPLPEGPWEARGNFTGFWVVWDRHEAVVASNLDEPIARAIATIPDMLAEINRLRVEDANMEIACQLEHRENDRLRALNAEMLEALMEWNAIKFHGPVTDAIIEKTRAILDRDLPTAADVRGILKTEDKP